MLRFLVKLSCIALALTPGNIEAAQVQLAPGNGVWLEPADTTVVNNEASVINTLKSGAIKHVFLYTIGYASSAYAAYAPFIQLAHNNGMTVHAVCANKANVTNNGVLSPILLSNALNQVFTYNSNYPAAAFDGVQIDVEGVTGSSLLALVEGVHVPQTLVFSAAVQPNEFYSGVESYYAALLQDTDLDVLIPMIYIMDGMGYSGGVAQFTFTIPSIASKTTEMLNLIASTQGQLMTGLSSYDYEFPISMSSGAIDTSFSSSAPFSQYAWSPGSTYGVPNLAATVPVVDVQYLTNSPNSIYPNAGVSIYRFACNSTDWMDVAEMTPDGLANSITAANQGGSGNSHYVGTCLWVYHTTFDHYSERQVGLIGGDTNYPAPVAGIQVLSFTNGLVQLQVTLTNTNPSQGILGAHSSAGVHLQLQGAASFVSASPGTFHAVEAFNSSGALLSSISGSQFLELRRMFFTQTNSQGAISGVINISAPASFTLLYRSWMTDKDSICNTIATSEPYIARSPNDVNYNAPARFATLATFATNFIAANTPAYVSAVIADGPFAYYRLNDTGVATFSNQLFTAQNIGTVGASGNGAAALTNGGISTSIVNTAPGPLANATNGAFNFPGSDTNCIIIPYRPEWNQNAPFTVEMWLKGGTNFCCPAASCQYDTQGWLFYQGSQGQTNGNGWWFRVYESNSVRVNAQINMTVATNAWSCVVGVYDGSSILLYTNGALAVSTVLTNSYTPNTNTALAMTVGARSGTTAYFYSGLISQFAFYTNALSASEIAAHYAAATTNAAGYGAQILARQPAGYWPFNDPLNPPMALDSGDGGWSFNGAYYNWSTNIPALESPAYPGFDPANKALQLFGTNGQVFIPPLNLNTNTVTFECWLNPNGTQQSYAGLVMHRNVGGGGSSGCGLDFHGTNNHLGYYWNDVANTYGWDSGLIPALCMWSYAALAVSPTQAVLCLCDGVTWKTATNTVSHAVQPFAGPIRIGSDGGTNRWFNGEMDEVAIYDKTLSPAQLLVHALAGFGNTNQPIFTTCPASQTVQAGSTATFSAVVAGTPAFACQWSVNGTNIPNATNLSLVIPNSDYTNAGQYHLGVTNGYGGVLSPVAVLVVMPPPSVTNLTFRISNGASGLSLGLIWSAGTLYSAGAVTGPWTVVNGATLPYYQVPINSSVATRFYNIQ
jgi:hypothetical protein